MLPFCILLLVVHMIKMPRVAAGGAAAAAAACVPVVMLRLPASLRRAALCSRQEPLLPLRTSCPSVADLPDPSCGWVSSEQQQRNCKSGSPVALPHALPTASGRAPALRDAIFSRLSKEQVTPPLRPAAAVATAAATSTTAASTAAGRTAAAPIAGTTASGASGRRTTAVRPTAAAGADGREAQEQQRHIQLQPPSERTALALGAGASAAAAAAPRAHQQKHGQRAPQTVPAAAADLHAAGLAAAAGNEGPRNACKKQPLLRDVVRTLAARVGFLEQQVAAVQRDIGRGRHQMKEFVIEKVLDLEDELRVIGHRSRQEHVAAAEAAIPRAHVDYRAAAAATDGTSRPPHAGAAAPAAERVAAEPAAEAVVAEATPAAGETAAANAAAHGRHGGCAYAGAEKEQVAAAAGKWGQDGRNVGWYEEETAAAAERRGSRSSETREGPHLEVADINFVWAEKDSAAAAAEAGAVGGGATRMSSDGSGKTPHSVGRAAAAEAAPDFDSVFFDASLAGTFSSSSKETAEELPEAGATAGAGRSAGATKGRKPDCSNGCVTAEETQGLRGRPKETDQEKQQPTMQRQQPQQPRKG